MEKELQALLNFRFGYGTWDELPKKCNVKLEQTEKNNFTIQKERQRAHCRSDKYSILLSLMAGIIFGVLYLIGVDRGLFQCCTNIKILCMIMIMAQENYIREIQP